MTAFDPVVTSAESASQPLVAAKNIRLRFRSMGKRPHLPLRLYWEPFVPFLMVIAGLAALSGLIALAARVQPSPGQRVFIPREWTCHGKSGGGFCERTGGTGPNGPWGTEKPPAPNVR